MTASYEWSGRVGDAWAELWRQTDRSFAPLDVPLEAAILAAAPDGEGRAVDLGCGAGTTSLAVAAARPALAVTGVDVSPGLVAVAQERAAGKANLTIRLADVAADPAAVAAGADLLISRHGVMFYPDPAATFAALRTAAAPCARLVFSCFQSRGHNEWATDLLAAVVGPTPPPPASAGYAPGPFAFADRDWVAAMLATAGWQASPPTPVTYPYVAGLSDDPIAEAVAFFSRIGPVASAIAAAPAAQRPYLRDRLAAALARHRRGNRIVFSAAAWIWHAVAEEPRR